MKSRARSSKQHLGDYLRWQSGSLSKISFATATISVTSFPGMIWKGFLFDNIRKPEVDIQHEITFN